MHNTDDIIEAISNHTALKLAGIQFPERLRVLENRYEQIGGMIELTRRLNADRALLRFLEQHSAVLKREIEDE